MNAKSIRSAWAEIDTAALEHNIKSIKKHVGDDIDLMGVIKADAYGHGAVKTAEILEKCGVNKFAVATVLGGIDLREAGFSESITILSLCPDSAAEALVEYDLSPLVDSFSAAESFSAAAGAAGRIMDAYIALDTGMGRIGYTADDPATIDEICRLSSLDNFHIRGLFSHFSTSDEKDKSYTEMQHRLFMDCRDKLAARGIEIPSLCIANSGAITDLPAMWHDTVRPGIILYGYYPSEDVDHQGIALKPVMSVRARIMRLRRIPAGFTVSYGRHFTAEKDTLIATIPVGYADGYPRSLSCRGRVIVNGQYAPVIGNICMDQCMIDVTGIHDVCKGDIVTVMGSDGTCSVTADDIAALSDTINYEILCGFGQRLAKVYTDTKGEY